MSLSLQKTQIYREIS